MIQTVYRYKRAVSLRESYDVLLLIQSLPFSHLSDDTGPAGRAADRGTARIAAGTRDRRGIATFRYVSTVPSKADYAAAEAAATATAGRFSQKGFSSGDPRAQSIKAKEANKTAL